MEISTAGAGRQRIESVGQWRAASRRPAVDWMPYGPAAHLAQQVLVDEVFAPGGAFVGLLAAAGLKGFVAGAATVEPPLLPSHFSAVGRPHDLMVQGTCAAGSLLVVVDARTDTPFGDETVGQRLAKDDGTAPGLDRFVEKLFTGPAGAAEALPLSLVALLGSAALQAKAARVSRVAVLFTVRRGPYVRAEPAGKNAIAVDAVVRHLSVGTRALLHEGWAGAYANRLGPPLTVVKRIEPDRL